ncbi:MAG: GNAT family N-acetyltransferase [Clostridium sp.]|nr:GNAT family N-acetyltransferase [Clostridium sp.]
MYTVRKYKSSDRERLRYIAMETAWESYKKNADRRETVAILYNDYFTKYESDNIFVAVDEKDVPVGYVICSTNYDLFEKKNREEFLPKAMKLYKPIGLVHLMLMSTLKQIKYERRVHLHIDLLPEAQHQGLGTKLFDALSNHLYKNGYDYMAVCGVNRYAGSYIFYQKYGFVTYRNHLFGRATLGIRTKGKDNG